MAGVRIGKQVDDVVAVDGLQVVGDAVFGRTFNGRLHFFLPQPEKGVEGVLLGWLRIGTKGKPLLAEGVLAGGVGSTVDGGFCT
jgi:hypothetical protein